MRGSCTDNYLEEPTTKICHSWYYHPKLFSRKFFQVLMCKLLDHKVRDVEHVAQYNISVNGEASGKYQIFKIPTCKRCGDQPLYTLEIDPGSQAGMTIIDNVSIQPHKPNIKQGHIFKDSIRNWDEIKPGKEWQQQQKN